MYRLIVLLFSLALATARHHYLSPEKSEFAELEAYNQRAERIIAARTRSGLNKSEFARELNCPWTTVHAWETAKYVPKADTLKKICQVLGVEIEQLLGVAGGQEPDFDAWRQFLETAEGQSMSVEEADALRAFNWPSNKAPTLLSYAQLLSVIRLASDAEISTE